MSKFLLFSPFQYAQASEAEAEEDDYRAYGGYVHFLCIFFYFFLKTTYYSSVQYLLQQIAWLLIMRLIFELFCDPLQTFPYSGLKF